jgi:hypothetical protein
MGSCLGRAGTGVGHHLGLLSSWEVPALHSACSSWGGSNTGLSVEGLQDTGS